MTNALQFAGTEPKRLILHDGTAQRAAELVANQVIDEARPVGEEVLSSEVLDAVVLKCGTMPAVSPAPQHSVSNESATFAILRRVCVGNDPVFLNGVRGDAGRGAAFVVRRNLAPPRLALFVIVGAFHQVAACPAARAVHFGAAVSAASVLWNCACHQFNERVLITHLQWHLLPNAAIN